MTDGLGFAWAPDGTQPIRGEDALRAVPDDPLTRDAVLPDPSARRPGDLVVPAVPGAGDARLQAAAVTRWMDDDRERSLPRPARVRHPEAPPATAGGDGRADLLDAWNLGTVQRRPEARTPRIPATTGAPPVPVRASVAGWLPVVALLVMLLVIAMVVVLGTA